VELIASNLFLRRTRISKRKKGLEVRGSFFLRASAHLSLLWKGKKLKLEGNLEKFYFFL